MPKEDGAALAIRPFAPHDRDAAVRLWRACGLVMPWNDPVRDMERKQRVDPDLFLVGLLADRLVGTVMAGYEGHRGWINYLAVAPSQRRRGLGRRLLMAAEERLRARGCPKINLQVRAANSAALAFYEALGFARDDVVSMGKRLVADEGRAGDLLPRQ